MLAAMSQVSAKRSVASGSCNRRSREPFVFCRQGCPLQSELVRFKMRPRLIRNHRRDGPRKFRARTQVADGSAHVEAVARALSTFGREARMSIDETNAFGDGDTADLFTEISRGIAKWFWFVEARTQASK